MVGGILVGMVYPLFFETAVELTYPINEIISGGTITFAITLIQFISVFIYGTVGVRYVTVITFSL